MVELEIIRDRVSYLFDGAGIDIEWYTDLEELYEGKTLDESRGHGYQEGYLDCSKAWQNRMESLLDHIEFLLKEAKKDEKQRIPVDP